MTCCILLKSVKALRSVPPRARRNNKFKDCTTRHICGCPQPAAEGFDDRTTDRQPQSQTVRLGSVEGVEKAIEGGRCQSGTRILHSHKHGARLLHPAADEQLPRPVTYATHRLDRINDQIENNLL